LKRSQIHHPPIRKQDESCARSEEGNAETFSVYFFKIFKPNPREITLEEENRLLSDTSTPTTQDTPTSPFTVNKMKAIIKYLNAKKAPGYDFITNQILQRLPKMGIKYITQLCNII